MTGEGNRNLSQFMKAVMAEVERLEVTRNRAERILDHLGLSEAQGLGPQPTLYCRVFLLSARQAFHVLTSWT